MSFHHSLPSLPVLFFLIIGLGLCAGCDRDNASQHAPLDETISPISTVDLPVKPSRVVSLAPNITEILFALDAGDSVAAVTRYCDYPPEVESRPKIGGMLDPDFEAILGMKPDLILGVKAGTTHQLPEKLEKANVPYLFLSMDTNEATYESIRQIARAMGIENKAQELISTIQRDLNTLQANYKEQLPKDGKKPTVLLLYDHRPIVAAGPGSFADELIQMAGAQNATAAINNPYPILDMEQVIALDPDFIIDATISYTDETQTADWQRYQSLRAYKAQQMVHFPNPVLMRPGPRLADALKLIGNAIYSTPGNDQ